jgi:hypothetical protein
MRASLLCLAALTLTGLVSSAHAQPQTPIRVQDFLLLGGNTVTVQDPDAPVSFQMPGGWSLTGGIRWGNHETTLQLFNSQTATRASVYYQYPIQTAIPANLNAALTEGANNKVLQRQRGGLKDYHIRAGSEEISTADGRPVLSFVGEFTGMGKRPMVEYLVRLLAANGKIEFFATMPAQANLPAFVNQLNPIVLSMRMP